MFGWLWIEGMAVQGGKALAGKAASGLGHAALGGAKAAIGHLSVMQILGVIGALLWALLGAVPGAVRTLIQPAGYVDCSPLPAGGAVGVAYRVGGALHRMTEPPPTAVEIRSTILSWARTSGEAYTAFTAAVNGATAPTTAPPVAPDPSTQVGFPGTTTTCCPMPPTVGPISSTAGLDVAVHALLVAGWPRDVEKLTIAASLPGPESGYSTTAIGGPNSNGTFDYGLWQINDIHFDPAVVDWKDPVVNAKLALAVYTSQGFGAWSSYNAGLDVAYRAAARVAVMKALGIAGPFISVSMPTTTTTPAALNCTPGQPVSTGAASPIAVGTYTITSPFGPRWGKLHAGLDMAAPSGTPIVAALPGVVVSAGMTSGGYGILTVIRSAGADVVYGHQSAVTVAAGQSVAAGQRIGSVGTTGDSTGNHLHFEIRVGGQAVDPVPFMRARGVDLLAPPTTV